LSQGRGGAERKSKGEKDGRKRSIPEGKGGVSLAEESERCERNTPRPRLGACNRGQWDKPRGMVGGKSRGTEKRAHK